MPTDKTLKVTVSGPFNATLVGDNNVTVGYKIKNGDTTKTSTLTFVKPDAAPYAGSYTSTVTFEVSVG